MRTTIWKGTVDNLELLGIAGGDQQPMRITEDGDGRLMTEFAISHDTDDGVEYTSEWNADTGMRFRDMVPAPSAELHARLLSSGLIEA